MGEAHSAAWDGETKEEKGLAGAMIGRQGRGV